MILSLVLWPPLHCGAITLSSPQKSFVVPEVPFVTLQLTLRDAVTAEAKLATADPQGALFG